MSLPTLAELPAILLPYANRAEQSFRDAVAALDDDHGLSAWTPQRWADFARVCAASDFVIEQSVRDPLKLLELAAWGELDRGFAPGELCGQIAGAVQQAETEDELGRVLRRQRTRQQVRIIWRDLTRQAGWDPALAREDLVLQWEEVAGEETARHAHPVALGDGVLTVQCDSTAWAKNLHLMRGVILTEIMARFPDAGVQNLRFVGPDVPSWKWGPRAVPGRGPRDTYG